MQTINCMLITVFNNKFQEFYRFFINCADDRSDYTVPDRNVF